MKQDFLKKSDVINKTSDNLMVMKAKLKCVTEVGEMKWG